jgi:hypothetical protein
MLSWPAKKGNRLSLFPLFTALTLSLTLLTSLIFLLGATGASEIQKKGNALPVRFGRSGSNRSKHDARVLCGAFRRQGDKQQQKET